MSRRTASEEAVHDERAADADCDSSFDRLASVLPPRTDHDGPRSSRFHPFESSAPRSRPSDSSPPPPPSSKAGLRVSESGAWFELYGAQVDCTDPAMARVLERLAYARAVRPGESVMSHELTAAWSGEGLSAVTARGRLSSTLTSLCEMGLEGLLIKRRGGFLLDPKVAFALGLRGGG